LTKQKKIIEDRFYETPLAKMSSNGPRTSKNMADVFISLKNLVEELLAETSKLYSDKTE